MRFLRHLLSTAALLGAVSLPLAADTTGDWQFDGDVAGNPLRMLCALTQDGGKLSGSCKSDQGMEIKLAGTVEGPKVTFTYNVDYQGSTYTLTYTGKLTDMEMSLTGDIEVAGTSGTFSAKKKA